MTRLKKWGKILFFILLITLVLLAYGWKRWQDLKHELGLELNWQGLSLNVNGILIDNFNLTLPIDNKFIEIHGENFTLSWFKAQATDVIINIKPVDLIKKSEKTTGSYDVLDTVKQLSWLPSTVKADNVTLNYPCAKNICQTLGSFLLTQNNASGALFKSLIDLKYEQHVLRLTSELYKKDKELKLTLEGSFNQQPLIHLCSQLNAETLDDYSGQLQLYKLKDAQGLFVWLQQWLPANQQVINQLPEAVELVADWQLVFSKDILPDQGHINLIVTLPQPWPLPQLGYLQGNIDTQLFIKQQALTVNKMVANVELTSIDPMLLTNIPKDLQPASVNLQLTGLAPNTIDSKSFVIVNINSTGLLNTKSTGTLIFDTQKKSLDINNGVLTANANKLKVQSYTLQALKANIPFAITATTNDIMLTISNQNAISLAQLTHPELTLKNAKLTTSDSKLQLNYPNNKPKFTIESGINLSVSSINNSLLKPSNWKADGALTGNLQQISAKAKITNGVGLSITTDITNTYNKQLIVQAKTPDIFFKADNSLAKTLANWPSLLELTSGKANAQATITVPFNKKPLQVSANLNLYNISGIYDRAELHKLSGNVDTSIKTNLLNISFNKLVLEQANPGVIIGPIKLTGKYSAPLSDTSRGVLEWSEANLVLLKGDIWLEKGSLNMDKFPQQVNLHIKGVQLDELFKAYPVDGLAGDGIIDGQLPIILNPSLEIEKGTLVARRSGLLHFDSPKIQALGKSNPSMQIITDALEDFKYTTLTSQANYKQGDLTLAINIEGQNPNIDKGRLINLNINLQENLPALFISLQLSDRVSEPIRKRVQERLQNHNK